MKNNLIDCKNKTIDEIYNLIQNGYKLDLDWKTVKEILPVHTFSKQEASKYKPTTETFLISIQDSNKKVLSFKEKTNHITRKLYKDFIFLFFDDLNIWETKFYNSTRSFTKDDASLIINTLDKWFKNKKPEKIIVHCEMGVSRSQAVALFIAKYYYEDKKMFEILNSVKGTLFNGNDLVYKLLTEAYKEKFPEKKDKEY